MSNPTFEAAGLQVFERGWLSSNSVLFDGGQSGESVLVDSGYCTHAAQTIALVRAALGARQLDRVVNTHLHSDHCGGNQALQAAFECRIDVPFGEIGKVDRWDEDLLTFRDTGQECPRFRRAGALLAGGDVQLGTMRWQAIASPGHDPESIALYQPDLQILISADALWENGFGVVFPEIEGIDAFDKVRYTLDRFESLAVRWIIPGHGPPFQHLDAAISRARARLDSFVADPRKHSRHAAKVLIKFRLLDAQAVTTSELTSWLARTRFLKLTHAKFFGTTPFKTWCDSLLDDLSRSRAISFGNGMIMNN